MVYVPAITQRPLSAPSAAQATSMPRDISGGQAVQFPPKAPPPPRRRSGHEHLLLSVCLLLLSQAGWTPFTPGLDRLRGGSSKSLSKELMCHFGLQSPSRGRTHPLSQPQSHGVSQREPSAAAGCCEGRENEPRLRANPGQALPRRPGRPVLAAADQAPQAPSSPRSGLRLSRCQGT